MLKKMFVGGLLAASAVGAAVAGDLEVPVAGGSIRNDSVAYDNMTFHGSYTVGEGAVVTAKANAVVHLGPETGENPVWEVKDGGRQLFLGTTDIKIGENGGSGLIKLSSPTADVMNWLTDFNVKKLTFGDGSTTLTVSENAADPDGDGYIDFLEVYPSVDACFYRVKNENRLPARILFKGGAIGVKNYYHKTFLETPKDTTIVLQSVDGNPIQFDLLLGAIAWLDWYVPSSQRGLSYVRTEGTGPVVFKAAQNGRGANGEPATFQAISDHCQWNHTGETRLVGELKFACKSSNVIPNGEGKSPAFRLSDAKSALDICGLNQAVNALLGCGLVTNSETKAGTITVGAIHADATLSDILSPDLQYAANADEKVVLDLASTGTTVADFLPSGPRFFVSAGALAYTGATNDSTGVNLDFSWRNSGSFEVRDGLLALGKLHLPANRDLDLTGGILRMEGDEDVGLHPHSVAADATLEKTGSGTMRYYDSDLAFGGTLRVKEGTFRFSAVGCTNDYWRFVFREMSNKGKFTNMGDMKLLANDGTTQVNKNVTTNGVEQGTAAKDLPPGTVTCPADYRYNVGSNGAPPGLITLFDGKRWSVIYSENYNLDGTSDPLPFWLRLPANHAAVSSYTFLWGWSSECPTRWSVETSPDGENWTSVYEGYGKLDADGDGNCERSWLSGYETPGAAGLAATSRVRVDAGATLDLSFVKTGGDAIGGLEVSYTQGGGTITSASLQPNGVIDIVDVPDGVRLSDYQIPLTFGSLACADLSGWTVKINGQVNDKRRLVRDGDKLRIISSGTMLLIR